MIEENADWPYISRTWAAIKRIQADAEAETAQRIAHTNRLKPCPITTPSSPDEWAGFNTQVNKE